MSTASAINTNANGNIDLRDWLKEVKRLEQLETISGAHWDLELGALTEIILERIATPPAVLFRQCPRFGTEPPGIGQYAGNFGAHRTDAKLAVRLEDHSIDRCPARALARHAADSGQRR